MKECKFKLQEFLEDKHKDFMTMFDRMFPKKACGTLGLKLAEISNNMFLNDFLYNVLGETKTTSKQVMREYFRLNDTEFDQEAVHSN